MSSIVRSTSRGGKGFELLLVRLSLPLLADRFLAVMKAVSFLPMIPKLYRFSILTFVFLGFLH